MSSIEDLAANQVFLELRQEIVSYIDVDTFVPSLHGKRWLTLQQLQYLQNSRSGLTEQERKHYLINHCLMDKGLFALQILLEVLDETSKLYDPHEKLSHKIKLHYQNVLDRLNQETLVSNASCPNMSTTVMPAPTPAITLTSVSSMPDIIPQQLSRYLPNHSDSTARHRSESTCSHRRLHAAVPAHHYYVKVVGTSTSTEYLSASLNNPTGFKGADSSLVETYEPTEEVS